MPEPTATSHPPLDALRSYLGLLAHEPPRIAPGSRFADLGVRLTPRRREPVRGIERLPGGFALRQCLEVPLGFSRIHSGSASADLAWAIQQWVVTEGVEADSALSLGMIRVPDDAWLLWYEEVRDPDGRSSKPVLSFGGGMTVATRPSHAQQGRCVALVLEPWACLRLFDIPLAELAGRRWCADRLWGHAGAALLAAMTEEACPFRQLELLLDAVRHRLRREPEAEAMHTLCRGMVHDLGDPGVSAQARRRGLSTRSLQRRFALHVGLPPKVHQGVVRIRQAVEAIARGRPLADVALETGYSDQSHFTRDCRRRLGLPPGRFADLLQRGTRLGRYWFLPAAIVGADGPAIPGDAA